MGAVLYDGSQRFRTVDAGRETRHSFSFGAHYDPGNLSFGALTCLNDDRLAPGAGYPDHGHTDVEILTWVLEGALEHADSLGRSRTLTAGTVQVQSAGAGIRHSELAHPDAPRTHLVQLWLRPDEYGVPPGAARDRHEGPGLACVAGGDGLPLGVAGALVRAGTLGGGERLEPRGDRLVHVFVATGSLLLTDGSVAGAGDAVRVVDGSAPLAAGEPTRLLVVELPVS